MKFKKIFNTLLCSLLAFVMFFSTSATSLAEIIPAINPTTSNANTVIVTDEGVFIRGTYYTQIEFKQLLNSAVQIETSSNNNDSNLLNTTSSISINSIDGSTVSGLLALFAGTWEIPVVGEVVITVAGGIIIAGVAIAAGNWMYDTVTGWFADKAKAEISEAKANIPERLKDDNGEVDLGKFDQKVSGKTAYKEKGGWTVEKDTAGHGGRKWKLKDKSGDRVASLDGNGKVLSK